MKFKWTHISVIYYFQIYFYAIQLKVMETKIAIMITFSNNMEKWVRGVGNMEFQFMGGIDIFILLSIAFCINELFPKQWENKY